MNKTSSPKKPATKRPSQNAKKSQAHAPQPFRYATWVKCLIMLLGIIGVSFILLGTYGTFRALIHRIQYEEVANQNSTDHVAPRAADGSRPSQKKEAPKAPVQNEPKEIREALNTATNMAKQADATPPTTPAKQSPAKPTAPKTVQPQAPVVPAQETTTSPSKMSTTDPSQPKMVIVIDDIGESLADVRALLSLDFPVTFAIWPHATHAKKADMLIYSEGKEIIVHQPMQAMDRAADPGKGALYVGMTAQEIRTIVLANLALVPHAIGLNNHMGSRFTQDPSISTVCEILKERRLFALDSFTHASSIFHTEAQKIGLASARRNVFLDAVAGEKNVLYELSRAENIAHKNGLSIAIGHPFDTTISGLKAWSKIRDKSIVIVRLQDIVH
ncbi:MAG: divergent polysaccharide deacetylase family protein [Pseudomonadota bacterium]